MKVNIMNTEKIKFLEEMVAGYKLDSVPFDNDTAFMNGVEEGLKIYKLAESKIAINSYEDGIIYALRGLYDE